MVVGLERPRGRSPLFGCPPAGLPSLLESRSLGSRALATHASGVNSECWPADFSIQSGGGEANGQPLPEFLPWLLALCVHPPRWPGTSLPKAKSDCAAPAERADLTQPLARPFQVADRRPGREPRACAHDIPGDKDVSGLAAGGSDAVSLSWELLEGSRHCAPRPSRLAHGGLVIIFLTEGARDVQNTPPWTTGLVGREHCSEPTDGHGFLLVTAGTFLLYYTQYLKQFPFPGTGRLSIIDKIREIKLEKVM